MRVPVRGRPAHHPFGLWLGLAMILLLLPGGIGLTWRALSTHSPEQRTVGEPPPGNIAPSQVPSTHEWRTYSDTELRLSLEYPESWFIQQFEDSCRIVQRGVLVSNVEHTFRHPEIRSSCTSAWDMRGVPPGLLVIEVRHFEGGPSPTLASTPDTKFPLSLDDADVLTTPASDAFGAPQPFFDLRFQVSRDNRYDLRVWIGSEVSSEDRQAAERIVRSVAFSGH